MHSVDSQSVGHIVVDGLRERVGLLKHHPDAAAQGGDIHGEGALAIEQRPRLRRGRRERISCIRFRRRRKVDFPQPEGPIKAVI